MFARDVLGWGYGNVGMRAFAVQMLWSYSRMTQINSHNVQLHFSIYKNVNAIK